MAAPTEVTAMKVYFVLPDGVHLYNPLDHTLQQIDDQDVREAMAAALMNQTGAPTGGCQVVLAASAQDYNRRYGARGRTVMALHAGQMARNMQLEAAAQGLTFISVDAVDAAAVKRVIRGIRAQEPLYVALVGYPVGQTPSAASEQTRATQATVLFVVPPQGFQDEELLVTKRGLEQAGAQVLIASTRMGLLTGMLGGTMRADLLLNQANLDNFSAVVFIGGVGAIDYLNSPVVAGVVRPAARSARCWRPSVRPRAFSPAPRAQGRAGHRLPVGTGPARPGRRPVHGQSRGARRADRYGHGRAGGAGLCPDHRGGRCRGGALHSGE